MYLKWSREWCWYKTLRGIDSVALLREVCQESGTTHRQKVRLNFGWVLCSKKRPLDGEACSTTLSYTLFFPLFLLPPVYYRKRWCQALHPLAMGRQRQKKAGEGDRDCASVGVCMCEQERRVYLSVILFFYFLHVLTHTMTLNSISLSFSLLPSLSFSPLSHCLCSVSFNEMNFSSLHASV